MNKFVCIYIKHIDTHKKAAGFVHVEFKIFTYFYKKSYTYFKSYICKFLNLVYLTFSLKFTLNV